MIDSENSLLTHSGVRACAKNLIGPVCRGRLACDPPKWPANMHVYENERLFSGVVGTSRNKAVHHARRCYEWENREIHLYEWWWLDMPCLLHRML